MRREARDRGSGKACGRVVVDAMRVERWPETVDSSQDSEVANDVWVAVTRKEECKQCLLPSPMSSRWQFSKAIGYLVVDRLKQPHWQRLSYIVCEKVKYRNRTTGIVILTTNATPALRLSSAFSFPSNPVKEQARHLQYIPCSESSVSNFKERRHLGTLSSLGKTNS